MMTSQNLQNIGISSGLLSKHPYESNASQFVSFFDPVANMKFPYTYINCPCTSSSQADENLVEPADKEDEDEEDNTFDPWSPRVNFALYPLEHLLYCEDCQQIRCPRCTVEEIVCWFCPSCLFETPTSMVKSEGGR